MIESRFWRAELRADIGWLRQHQRYKRWTEKQQVLFERRLMIVAFQIRALLDRPKVDGKVRRARVPAQFYRKIGTEPVTLLNAIDFDAHFDLGKGNSITLPVREVCNQLIHHYAMFAIGRAGSGFELVVVFSDYKKNVGMYQVEVAQLIELFSLFAADSSHAHHVRMEWSEKRQDYEFSTEDSWPNGPVT
jgi:hypothetical protein